MSKLAIVKKKDPYSENSTSGFGSEYQDAFLGSIHPFTEILVTKHKSK